MIRYNTFKLRPLHFRAFTGLKVEEFDKLVNAVKFDWGEQRIIRLQENNPKPKRRLGGGRKPILEKIEDQLLLTILWSRLYPGYLMLEYLFGVDESTACRTITQIKFLMQDKFVFQDPRKSGKKKITTLEQ